MNIGHVVREIVIEPTELPVPQEPEVTPEEVAPATKRDDE
jgi:hypothetical protein